MRIRKYNNRHCKSGGITFDSKMERDYYHHLLWKQKAGEINSLKTHVRYPLKTKDGNSTSGDNAIIGYYECDFYYRDKEFNEHYEDVKGVLTDLFRWKVKHFQIQYGIPITIVTKKKGRWIYK